MMNPERFKTLAASYGADIKRWPADEQSAAIQLNQQSDMGLIMHEASALDSLLAAHSVATNNSELADVIFAKALNTMVVKEKLGNKRSGAWQKLSDLLAEIGLNGFGLAGAGLASALAGVFCVSILTGTMSPKAISHEAGPHQANSHEADSRLDSANSSTNAAEYLDYGQEWR